jgi:hypothetical protein
MNKLSIFGLFIFIALFTSCGSTKNTKITENKNDKTDNINSTSMDNYYTIKEGESIFSRMDEKVCFEATISKEIYQHMIKMSPPFQEEKEEQQYIDPASKYKGGQIVAYYFPSKVKWPANKSAKFLVYGTMSSMTGPGKGGGEHTEYYLILDKVVELK